MKLHTYMRTLMQVLLSLPFREDQKSNYYYMQSTIRMEYACHDNTYIAIAIHTMCKAIFILNEYPEHIHIATHEDK